MMLIRLGPEAVRGQRFAVSPLAEVSALLVQVAAPSGGPRQRVWRTQVADLVCRRLPLLRGLLAPGYLPDLMSPFPERAEASVEEELDQVAATPPERVRLELEMVSTGLPAARLGGRPLAPQLHAALDRGERAFAEAIAAELLVVWQELLAPDWPRLRADLVADVETRAGAIAREGLAGATADLAAAARWTADGLAVESRFEVDVTTCRPVVLVPSSVAPAAAAVVDPCPGHGRPITLGYPVARRGSHPTGPHPAAVVDLLGPLRAALLLDCAMPRTTGELAARHGAAPSTVSYHLGVLHRAGLVDRSRDGGRVRYLVSPLGRRLQGHG